jgi:hypothetical protein
VQCEKNFKTVFLTGDFILKRFMLAFLLILLIPYSSYSQEAKSPKIGFGTSLVEVKDIARILSGDGDIDLSIFIPIQISSKFMLEPEIGFLTASSEEKSPWDKDKLISKAFHIGIGVFPMKKMGSYKLYYGARFGYIHNSSDEKYAMDSDEESSSSGFYISPSLGGEYFLIKHFSLGAEIQIRYASLSGETKIETTGDKDLSSSSMSTRALVLVRFYL